MAKSKFTKIEVQSVFQQAVEQIRDLVTSDEFAPGDSFLTEVELSNRLNISRPTVREALRVLESQGLIEVRRGSGTYVTQNQGISAIIPLLSKPIEESDEDIHNLFDIRESMEMLTVSLVAASAPDSVIEELEEIVREQEQLLDEMDDSEELRDRMGVLGSRFHRLISKASQNDFAEEIISHVHPVLLEPTDDRPRLSQRVSYHRLLIDAIQTRDPISAEKIMQEHIASERSAYLDIVHQLKGTSSGHPR